MTPTMWFYVVFAFSAIGIICIIVNVLLKNWHAVVGWICAIIWALYFNHSLQNWAEICTKFNR